MKTNFSVSKIAGLLTLTCALGGVGLVACSGSDNPTPVDGGVGDGGIIVIDAGAPKDASTTADALVSDASGDAGGDAAGGFTGPNGCWQGPATTSNQALNACTDGTCTPFINVDRLPLYNNGNLPAVP